MAALASHFKQQELSDIDVTIYSYTWARQVPAAGLEPAPKRTKVENAAAAKALETASPPAAAAAAAGANSSCFARLEALSTFPGHRIVLFTSEFFQAQVGRPWQKVCKTQSDAVLQPCSQSSLIASWHVQQGRSTSPGQELDCLGQREVSANTNAAVAAPICWSSVLAPGTTLADHGHACARQCGWPAATPRTQQHRNLWSRCNARRQQQSNHRQYQ